MSISNLPDFSELAKQIVSDLQRYLPLFAGDGAKAADKKAPALIERAWTLVKDRFSRKPAAEEALRELLVEPNDGDLQAAMRVQLRRILEVDSEFAADLWSLAQAIAAQATDQTSTFKADIRGDRNTTIQGTAITIHTSLNDDSREEAALERAYLSRLFEQCSGLDLAGIDRQAEARLSLHAVYTSIDTLASRAVVQEILEQDKTKRSRPSDMPANEEAHLIQRQVIGKIQGSELKPVPAIERVKDSSRLVILGDPGSGKSTFVNYIAMCLCGERLGRPEANLGTLIGPGYRDLKLKWWSHGPLPVRVILREFSARSLPPIGEIASGEHLWKFIVAELGETLGEWAAALKKELLEVGGLVLLDGLDEVPEAGQRRVQLRQAIEGFAQTFSRCRILITGRTYAYQKQAWRMPGFDTAVLAPFSPKQIEKFIDSWYAYIAEVRDLKDGQARAQDLRNAIKRNVRLAEFAERPLLLTLMASLHAWRNGPLPENREELYNDAVDLLLDLWERPKRVAGERQPGLSEFLNVDKDRLRQALNELAFQAHSMQAELAGTADIDESKLVSALLGLSREKHLNPIDLLDYLSQRAGLLLPRGVGVYTFPHRTFQEYLAACYLTDHDYPDQLCRLVRDDFERWREVTRLAGAKATRGMGGASWSLAEALCESEPGQATNLTDMWMAYLAGQVLSEIAHLNQVSRRDQPKLARIKRWLIRCLAEPALPAIERARAGDALARLGETRPEVMTVEEMEFCYIPAGEFVMGDESTKHINHDVTYGYWIARYPVSVAQWRQYISESGQKPSDDESLRDPDNRPVRLVTWQETQEFCAWLQTRFGELLSEGFRFCLPSEAEWEKAARGGLKVPSLDTILYQRLRAGLYESPIQVMIDNIEPDRAYPWGLASDSEKLNFVETGIGATAALGCFPAGASPYGCQDMAGNAWEWTRSLHKGFVYDSTSVSEDLTSMDDRVIRGGAFGDEAQDTQITRRERDGPFGKRGFNGFRVAASPSKLSF